MNIDQLQAISDQEFKQLQVYLEDRIGVKLTDAKKSLAMSRLSKRIREIGLGSYQDYIDLVQVDDDELQVLFNRITTNVTHFFRESHHFDYLISTYLPALIEDPARAPNKTIRIWSAACSTGEEVYTIAMVLAEFLEDHPGWKVEILGSDISTRALDKAKLGIYSRSEVEGIPYKYLKKYFKLGQGDNEGLFKAKESIRKLVSFRQINLVSPNSYPISAPLHMIFCRNVFIYFDKETQSNIVSRFAKHLYEDGLLMIGHSESISTTSQADMWTLIGRTIYTYNRQEH